MIHFILLVKLCFRQTENLYILDIFMKFDCLLSERRVTEIIFGFIFILVFIIKQVQRSAAIWIHEHCSVLIDFNVSFY